MVKQRGEDNGDDDRSDWAAQDEWKEDAWDSEESPLPTTDEWGVEGHIDASSHPVIAPTPSPNRPKTPEELLRHPATIPLVCGYRGLTFACQGFVAGTLIGGVQSAMEGHNLGITRQPGFVRALMAASAGSGFQMAGWIGIYTSGKCACQLYRNKKDPLNTFVAAFGASVVTTIRSRNPRLIIFSGVGQGVLFAALDVILGGLPA